MPLQILILSITGTKHMLIHVSVYNSISVYDIVVYSQLQGRDASSWSK